MQGRRSTLEPTTDIVFKMLFGSEDGRECLKSLLTAVLRPKAPIERVTVLNPEVGKEEQEGKGVILDLLVALADGTRVDVEMQVEKRAGFRNRVVYYWAKAYGGQLVRGAQYTALRPTISILFLDYVELPGTRMHSVFRILEEHEPEPGSEGEGRGGGGGGRQAWSDDLVLHVVELPKRGWGEARQGERELVDWARFLGAKTDEEVKEACMGNPAVKKADDLLKNLSAKPSLRETIRRRQLAKDTYRIEMGAALEEGLERGREEGLRGGILALAEVLGLDVDEGRRAELERMSGEELAALQERLRVARRW